MYGTLGLFAVSVGTPVIRSEWDTLFAGYEPSPEWGQALWLLRWGLGETIVIVGDVPVPAIEIAEITWWAGLVTWLAGGGAACPDGCLELTFNRVPH